MAKKIIKEETTLEDQVMPAPVTGHPWGIHIDAKTPAAPSLLAPKYKLDLKIATEKQNAAQAAFDSAKDAAEAQRAADDMTAANIVMVDYNGNSGLDFPPRNPLPVVTPTPTRDGYPYNHKIYEDPNKVIYKEIYKDPYSGK